MQDLRHKFTGAIPLSEQEKFADLMIKLQDKQNTVEEDLKKVRDRRASVGGELWFVLIDVARPNEHYTC